MIHGRWRLLAMVFALTGCPKKSGPATDLDDTVVEQEGPACAWSLIAS
jgi:hypothetical protein